MKIAIVATSPLLATAIPATACRPRADPTILFHAQGCARRFVQMQAPARHCCQLRACMETGYRSNLIDREQPRPRGGTPAIQISPRAVVEP
jgi:hypothetical protein